MAGALRRVGPLRLRQRIRGSAAAARRSDAAEFCVEVCCVWLRSQKQYHWEPWQQEARHDFGGLQPPPAPGKRRERQTEDRCMHAPHMHDALRLSEAACLIVTGCCSDRPKLSSAGGFGRVAAARSNRARYAGAPGAERGTCTSLLGTSCSTSTLAAASASWAWCRREHEPLPRPAAHCRWYSCPPDGR